MCITLEPGHTYQVLIINEERLMTESSPHFVHFVIFIQGSFDLYISHSAYNQYTSKMLTKH